MRLYTNLQDGELHFILEPGEAMVVLAEMGVTLAMQRVTVTVGDRPHSQSGFRFTAGGEFPEIEELKVTT